MQLRLLCGAAALAMTVLAAPSSAKVVTTVYNHSFYDAPFTVDVGGGNSFTLSTVDKTFFSPNPAAVSTGGTLAVSSLGAPFYPSPVPSVAFPNRGTESVDANYSVFSTFATPTAIPYSATESILGFSFDSGRGTQYGFADFSGSFLHGIRLQTTPGAGVAIASVPEPASWAMMIAGFGIVGGSLRSRRRAAAAV